MVIERVTVAVVEGAVGAVALAVEVVGGMEAVEEGVDRVPSAIAVVMLAIWRAIVKLT